MVIVFQTDNDSRLVGDFHLGGIRRQNLVRARMQMLGQRVARVMKHPGLFAIRALKGFRANQGLLLAGAVAYYAVLSIVPLMILTVIALS
jgi:hypothetical protein